MKIVPIKKKSSITPIALSSLRHKSCIICGDDDLVLIRSLDEAYNHAWAHWEAWKIVSDTVPGQLGIPAIWQHVLSGLSEAGRSEKS